MSANINRASAAPKRILMIIANPATSPTTGWPIGFWAAELTHPYWAFVEVGYDVDIASPKGGALRVDGYSDPRDPSGYSAQDILSLGFLTSRTHAALLEETPSIAAISVSHYDAVVLVGGQSPMITFSNDSTLHKLVADLYQAGKVVSAVCHATCVLLKTKLANGTLLVDGKTWTGFANSEEQYADNFVGKKIQPFWIEDEAKKLPNINFVVNAMLREVALRDGRLVTGQQQYSGAAAAKVVIEALGV